MGLRIALGLRKRKPKAKKPRVVPAMNIELQRRATLSLADFVEPFLDKAVWFSPRLTDVIPEAKYEWIASSGYRGMIRMKASA